MSKRMQGFGAGFHHIRGEHRVGGLVDVGTHCALVELEDGFVFLDSYTLPDSILRQVLAMTDGGSAVRAIINVHPFHTVHVAWMHQTFARAKLYGTLRHRRKLAHLPWEDTLCDDAALSNHFGGTLEFSVPQGVDMVCEKERVHFGSVLAYHRASRTIYVDDTLSCVEAPFPLSMLPQTGRLDFHPSLPFALNGEPGAAEAFRTWAYDLGETWHDAQRITTAHNTVVELPHDGFPAAIGAALGRVQPVLRRHRASYG